jgi:hypothetical protein
MVIKEIVIDKSPRINKDGSKKIRERALRDYVEPALRDRRDTITIRVKDLMQKLESEGFPKNRPAQFCSALQERHFLQEHGLVVDRIEGPPSGKSTTVVLHLRVQQAGTGGAASRAEKGGDIVPPSEETPRQWAERVTTNLRGLLKNELAEYGGTEGFIRWIRSEDEL